MGVCVKSKTYEFSTGYITFNMLRLEIAGLLGNEWHTHYEDAIFAPYDMAWSEYNAKTEEMAKSLSKEDDMVVDFLYQPDCEGCIDSEHCKALIYLMERTQHEWKLDIRSWAYGADAPFTLTDFYLMLLDGQSSGEGIEWH